MSFTRAGDIAHDVKVPIKIGDLYVERSKANEPYPIGEKGSNHEHR